MKLNDRIIVTLSDLARHFNYAEFRANARSFIRDMHPDRVYYWSDELRRAYHEVAAWLQGGDRQAGLAALEMLLGRPLVPEEISDSATGPDLTARIIRVRSGATLVLPALRPERVDLCVHKIEAVGPGDAPVVVALGADCRRLLPSEFVYVTESDGAFIEFLPAQLENDTFALSLSSSEGRFMADLLIRTKYSGLESRVADVFSFALAEDGPVYIDSRGMPVYVSPTVAALKFLLRHDAHAVCVKACGAHAVILYADGVMKNTHGETSDGMLRADIQ